MFVAGWTCGMVNALAPKFVLAQSRLGKILPRPLAVVISNLSVVEGAWLLDTSHPNILYAPYNRGNHSGARGLAQEPWYLVRLVRWIDSNLSQKCSRRRASIRLIRCVLVKDMSHIPRDGAVRSLMYVAARFEKDCWASKNWIVPSTHCLPSAKTQEYKETQKVWVYIYIWLL